MKPLSLYLILYNLANMAGWAWVWWLAVNAYLNNVDPKDLWAIIGEPLTYVQTLAIMEVLHSLFGFVRSPLMAAILQVSSRVVMLYAYTIPVQAAHTHWSLYLMSISWATVEVPRYLFYALTVVMSSNKVPYPLFFLRYNLFMVLYPTGISGELLQMYNTLSHYAVVCPPMYRFTLVLMLAGYGPGSPFMIMNMWNMRKRAARSRANAGKPPRPVSGVSWPITNTETGERSSTVTNRKIWAAAFGAVSKEEETKVNKCKNWRYGYLKFVEKNVRLACESEKNAIAIAKAGLASAAKEFQFVKPDGKVLSLADAFAAPKGKEETFDTYVLKGEAPKPKAFTLEVPYAGASGKPYYNYTKFENLTGDKLKKQLDQWVNYGTIEQGAADAIKLCVENPSWLDLSDKYFVLLGATSAMGPLEILLKHGANVVAVDLDRDFIWKKLIRLGRASCGTIIMPVKKGALADLEKSKDKGTEKWFDDLSKVAGSDLLGKTTYIRNWLLDVCPGKQLTIGNYTYLDGALHVQLSVACNAIIDGLCAARKDTAVAFLCTPTDCHVIPQAAHDAAKENLRNAPFWQKLIAPFSKLASNVMKPVANKDHKCDINLVDGTVVQQGPNYALAKRMQHWMAVVQRANGHPVASNVAPSTATASVVHAWTFAAAYGGMHLFKPMEVMYQETSNAVMGALLIHDICNTKGAAYPAFKLKNPMELFMHGSFHGGIWRTGYMLSSTAEVTVVAYLLKLYGLHMTAGLAGLASLVTYIVTGSVGF